MRRDTLALFAAALALAACSSRGTDQGARDADAASADINATAAAAVSDVDAAAAAAGNRSDAAEALGNGGDPIENAAGGTSPQ